MSAQINGHGQAWTWRRQCPPQITLRDVTQAKNMQRPFEKQQIDKLGLMLVLYFSEETEPQLCHLAKNIGTTRKRTQEMSNNWEME